MEDDPVHPYDPHQQPPQQPPPVFVQQPSNRAATIGIWVLVLWIVGPALLLLLCCAGCLFAGGITAITDGISPGPTSSP